MNPIGIKQVRGACIRLAAAVSLVSGPPLFAQNDVLSRYGHWEKGLRNRVSSLLVYPEGMRPGASGDVLVSFAVGADGKPQQVTIRQSSGEPAFDRAAVRLVSDLGRLGPVPSSNGTVAAVTLKLSYGEPCARVRDCARLERKDAEDRQANDARNRFVVSASQVAQGR